MDDENSRRRPTGVVEAIAEAVRLREAGVRSLKHDRRAASPDETVEDDPAFEETVRRIAAATGTSEESIRSAVLAIAEAGSRGEVLTIDSIGAPPVKYLEPFHEDSIPLPRPSVAYYRTQRDLYVWPGATAIAEAARMIAELPPPRPNPDLVWCGVCGVRLVDCSCGAGKVLRELSEVRLLPEAPPPPKGPRNRKERREAEAARKRAARRLDRSNLRGR